MRLTEYMETTLTAYGVQVDRLPSTALAGLTRFGAAYEIATAIAAVSPAQEASLLVDVSVMIKCRAQLRNSVTPRVVNLTAEVSEDPTVDPKTVRFTFYA